MGSHLSRLGHLGITSDSTLSICPHQKYQHRNVFAESSLVLEQAIQVHSVTLEHLPLHTSLILDVCQDLLSCKTVSGKEYSTTLWNGLS
jgi:hypothetical protein